MGSDRRFTFALAGWIALLGAALTASVGAFMLPGLGAGRIVALLGVAGATAGLWLGSGPVDQSQKNTVAARAMAEKKAVGHLS
ncbi:hypothetical protein SLG_27160 [Sphingobium sp. SYK-6]|nr:hypothetical protein SLG_27160 [Sphingobium sp. SYK-6]